MLWVSFLFFHSLLRIKSWQSWTEYEPIWQVQNAHNSNRKECLAVLKFILDKTDPDTIFAAADTDQSGELSFEELDAAYGKLVGSNDILISDKWFFKYFTHTIPM